MRDEITIQTARFKSIKERVVQAVVSTNTPVTKPRIVQKKLNSVTTEVIQNIMEECSTEGFGFVQRNPAGTRMKFVFMKPVPGNEQVHQFLQANGANLELYRQNFAKTKEMSNALKDLLRKCHPHIDMFMDIL